jgi:hypothetical protein
MRKRLKNRLIPVIPDEEVVRFNRSKNQLRKLLKKIYYVIVSVVVALMLFFSFWWSIVIAIIGVFVSVFLLFPGEDEWPF